MTPKVRGQSKETKRWIYGGFMQTPEATFIIDYSIVVQKPRDGYPTVYDVVEVIPETVGQFTTIKDKNNNEIYANHKIKGRNRCCSDIRWEAVEGHVEWDTKSLSWHVRGIYPNDNGSPCWQYLVNISNLEIIGTIDEN